MCETRSMANFKIAIKSPRFNVPKGVRILAFFYLSKNLFMHKFIHVHINFCPFGEIRLSRKA